MNNKSNSQKLKSMYEKFVEREEFKLGTLVEWKKDFKNKRYPRYKQPAVVVEMLQEPIITNLDKPETQYYRESLDIMVGFLDEDGEFIVFSYDSRRFTRFQE